MNTYQVFIMCQTWDSNQQGPYYYTLHLTNDKTETNFAPMPQSQQVVDKWSCWGKKETDKRNLVINSVLT